MDKVAGPLKALAKIYGAVTRTAGKATIGAGKATQKAGKKIVQHGQKGVPGLTKATRATGTPGGVVHNPFFTRKSALRGMHSIPGKILSKADKAMGAVGKTGLKWLIPGYAGYELGKHVMNRVNQQKSYQEIAPGPAGTDRLSPPAVSPGNTGDSTGNTYPYNKHVIGEGETLDSISKKYYTTPADVMHHNPAITDPNIINAGDTLLMPSNQWINNQTQKFKLNNTGAGQEMPRIGTGDATAIRKQGSYQVANDLMTASFVNEIYKNATDTATDKPMEPQRQMPRQQKDQMPDRRKMAKEPPKPSDTPDPGDQSNPDKRAKGSLMGGAARRIMMGASKMDNLPTGFDKNEGGVFPQYKKDSKKAKEFRAAFAAADKAGEKTFKWDGREYTTEKKGSYEENNNMYMEKDANKLKEWWAGRHERRAKRKQKFSDWRAKNQHKNKKRLGLDADSGNFRTKEDDKGNVTQSYKIKGSDEAQQVKKTTTDPETGKKKVEGVSEKTKGGDYKVYGKESEKAQDFRGAFAAAKKSGKETFDWDGRSYSTKTASATYTLIDQYMD